MYCWVIDEVSDGERWQWKWFMRDHTVSRLRMWASSRITTPYCSKFGDSKHSLKRTPSVTYLIRVFSLQHLSKRTWYPTSSPTLFPLSWETLSATEIAATRRGCVTTMGLSFKRPASRMYWGSCVVFPDPVSPRRTKHLTNFWKTKFKDRLGEKRADEQDRVHKVSKTRGWQTYSVQPQIVFVPDVLKLGVQVPCLE